MFTKRIIPCLDVNDGRVVKGVNFVNLRDAGDPVEIAAAYDKAGADEVVFLDITASSDNRNTVVDMVRRVAENVFIPFTVGGGIRCVEDFKVLLREGADKISINSSAINTIISNTIILNYNSALGLILIPIISRSLMGYLLISKESMKGSSLGAFFKRGTGDVDKVILLTSLLISSLILIFIFGIYGLIISLGMNLISLYFVNNAIKEFDGMSGDSAGYGLVIAETVGILILSFI